MRSQDIPLPERMRPKSLSDYIGQKHLTEKGAIFETAIRTGVLPSLILWGPPGVGKTTLARLISQEMDRSFFTLSAINSGVKEVREIIAKAEKRGMFDQGNPILFIDEIHRFSKSQQDSLLGAVENGTIVLIGATTENPSFEVIPALLSRCQVYTLEHFSQNELEEIIQQALTKDVELQKLNIHIKEKNALFRYSGGDARRLLNLLEIAISRESGAEIVLDDEKFKVVAQNQASRYDKGGEMHYDIISAFIKSIRGSDPNAAVYWLARMIEGGEDPKFIARRLIILASEDIGNANPTALVMANNCFQAIERIGMPEGRIILSQCAVYLASSSKSNASYMAIKEAQSEVARSGDLEVPLALRNAPTKLMKELGYGDEYQYSHDGEGNFIEQEFLPKEIEGQKFYEPGKNAREEQMRQFLKVRWKNKYGY